MKKTLFTSVLIIILISIQVTAQQSDQNLWKDDIISCIKSNLQSFGGTDNCMLMVDECQVNGCQSLLQETIAGLEFNMTYYLENYYDGQVNAWGIYITDTTCDYHPVEILLYLCLDEDCTFAGQYYRGGSRGGACGVADNYNPGTVNTTENILFNRIFIDGLVYNGAVRDGIQVMEYNISFAGLESQLNPDIQSNEMPYVELRYNSTQICYEGGESTFNYEIYTKDKENNIIYYSYDKFGINDIRLEFDTGYFYKWNSFWKYDVCEPDDSFFDQGWFNSVNDVKTSVLGVGVWTKTDHFVTARLESGECVGKLNTYAGMEEWFIDSGETLTQSVNMSTVLGFHEGTSMNLTLTYYDYLGEQVYNISFDKRSTDELFYYINDNFVGNASYLDGWVYISSQHDLSSRNVTTSVGWEDSEGTIVADYTNKTAITRGTIRYLGFIQENNNPGVDSDAWYLIRASTESGASAVLPEWTQTQLKSKTVNGSGDFNVIIHYTDSIHKNSEWETIKVPFSVKQEYCYDDQDGGSTESILGKIGKGLFRKLYEDFGLLDTLYSVGWLAYFVCLILNILALRDVKLSLLVNNVAFVLLGLLSLISTGQLYGVLVLLALSVGLMFL